MSLTEDQVRQFYATLLTKEHESVGLSEFFSLLSDSFPEAGWRESQLSDCFNSLLKSEKHGYSDSLVTVTGSSSSEETDSRLAVHTILNRPDLLSQLFSEEHAMDIVAIQRDCVSQPSKVVGSEHDFKVIDEPVSVASSTISSFLSSHAVSEDPSDMSDGEIPAAPKLENKRSTFLEAKAILDNKEIARQRLFKHFSKFDRDGTGSLNYDQFKEAIESLTHDSGYEGTHSRSATSGGGSSSSSIRSEEDLSELVSALFKSLGGHIKGELKYEEITQGDQFDSLITKHVLPTVENPTLEELAIVGDDFEDTPPVDPDSPRNEHLLAELAELKVLCRDLQKYVNEVGKPNESRVQELEAELAHVNEENSKLNDTISELRSNLDQIATQTDDEIAVLTSQRDDLKTDLEHLKEEVKSLTPVPGIAGDFLGDDPFDQPASSSDTMMEVADSPRKDDVLMKPVMDHVTKQLSASLDFAGSHIEDLTTKIEGLQRQLTDSRLESEQLLEELKQAEMENGSLLTENQRLASSVDELESLLDDSRAEQLKSSVHGKVVTPRIKHMYRHSTGGSMNSSAGLAPLLKKGGTLSSHSSQHSEGALFNLGQLPEMGTADEYATDSSAGTTRTRKTHFRSSHGSSMLMHEVIVGDTDGSGMELVHTDTQGTSHSRRTDSADVLRMYADEILDMADVMAELVQSVAQVRKSIESRADLLKQESSEPLLLDQYTQTPEPMFSDQPSFDTNGRNTTIIVNSDDTDGSMEVNEKTALLTPERNNRGTKDRHSNWDDMEGEPDSLPMCLCCGFTFF